MRSPCQPTLACLMAVDFIELIRASCQPVAKQAIRIIYEEEALSYKRCNSVGASGTIKTL